MVKDLANPQLSPSRAVALARERAKRRQGRMWAGLKSTENLLIRGAEAVSMAEGKTDRTAKARVGRAPRCRRTQARMYVQRRDLGGLLPTAVPMHGGRQSERQRAKRRMNGAEESDPGIVPMRAANKAGGARWRSRRREGPGATGDTKE